VLGFNEASRFSIAGLRELPEDFSNALLVRADPVSLPAVLGRSIRRVPVSQVPAVLALRADVPVLARDLDLVGRVREDLADRAQAAPVGLRLRARLLARSVRLDVRVAETSSIRRPKKAR
jgi:hypothetical protein